MLYVNCLCCLQDDWYCWDMFTKIIFLLMLSIGYWDVLQSIILLRCLRCLQSKKLFAKYYSCFVLSVRWLQSEKVIEMFTKIYSCWDCIQLVCKVKRLLRCFTKIFTLLMMFTCCCYVVEIVRYDLPFAKELIECLLTMVWIFYECGKRC